MTDRAAFSIEEIREADAEMFVNFLKRIDQETDFLLWEPGERNVDLNFQRFRIQNIEPRKQLILVARANDCIVGFLSALVGGTQRITHRADFTMGVLPDFQGRGIGSTLLSRFEKWARALELRRLELTVMGHNEKAIRLYEKHGYLSEGLKREAIVVKGRVLDEKLMGKALV